MEQLTYIDFGKDFHERAGNPDMLHDNYFDQLGYQQLFEAFGLSPTTGRVTLPTLLIAPRHVLSLQLLCPWVYEKALSSAALQAVVGRLRFLHFGCFCNQAANLMRFPTCYLFASGSFHGFLSSAFFRFLPFFLPCLFFCFFFLVSVFVFFFVFVFCLFVFFCFLFLFPFLLLFLILSLSLALLLWPSFCPPYLSNPKVLQ